MLWQPAYVGIGSNLDDPELQVRRALSALATLERTRLVAQSSLYGSRPWGLAEQPDFVNAAAGLLTQLPVERLFEQLCDLQTRLGRAPSVTRWGPRRIDLDLLVFDHLSLQTAQLRLPHPGVVTRNFVLYPLCEIAPDLIVPGSASVRDLAAQADRTGIWRLDGRALEHGA
ncbi:MAG TPA: 2-amino-4-hydroxy-6-hydroxymethyldihydropteridine diphosphokinase [Steroidobacteraceae bacterium]|nr:2-amino-4-hydroxy-6-hydroxymethyldihydropteridine diphosphokinase [Steroidobacteraceae bacterium]